MKKYLAYLIALAAIVFTCGFSGCKTTQIAKQEKAAKALEVAKQKIAAKESELDDKGKAFVYGANYANKKESNRTIAVETSGRFLDLAQLTLGNPSFKDSKTVREIVDDLLAEHKAELALVNARSATSEAEAKLFRQEAAKYKTQAQAGETKLKGLENKVIILESQRESAKRESEKKLAGVMQLSKENAEKAAKYDEDHSFVNSINPFHDFKNGFKKLAGWGIFLGVLVVAFSVLETFFPQLKIFGVIFGVFGKIAMKLFPAAKKTAEVVSSKVWSGYKNIVVALEHFMEKLKVHPIEDKVLQNIPEEGLFKKSQIKVMLEQHTESILEEIKKELDEHQDDDSRALVQHAKSETNIKPMTKDLRI